MDDLVIMKSVDSLHHLNEIVPYDSFIKERTFSFLAFNYFQKISSLCKLKHNAETLWSLIIERLFVPNDVLVIDRRQNSNFIKRILSLFQVKALKGTLFKCVDESIALAGHFIDLSKGSSAWNERGLPSSWRIVKFSIWLIIGSLMRSLKRGEAPEFNSFI